MGDEYAEYAKIYDQTHDDKKTQDMYFEWIMELKKAIQEQNVEVKRLLDLGCGTGITTIPWLKSGYQVYGVDISKAMLKVAKKKSSKVKWLNQDITKLNIKENMDIVTCHFDVLNHVLKKANLKKVFKKVYNILNDRGLFMFDIMPSAAFKELEKRKRKHTITERPYSRNEIKDLLLKSGFKILKIKKQKVSEWDGKPRRIIFLVQK